MASPPALGDAPLAPPARPPGRPDFRRRGRLRYAACLGGRLWRVRRTFLLALLPWATLLVLIGALTYGHLSQTRLEPLRQAQDDLTRQGLAILNRWGAFLKRDLFFLARSPILARALDDGRLDDLAATWQSFATTAGIYDQIRWIDETGRERLRIELDEGHGKRVPPLPLDPQQFATFHAAMGLHPGQVYYSRLDLHRDQGHIALPYQPCQRLATPLYDGRGRSRGVLVFNFRAQALFDRLAQMPSSFGLQLHLVDQEGYWLIAPNPIQAWGFMLGQADMTVGHRHPTLWSALQQRTRGEVQDSAGQWRFDTYTPIDNAPSPLGEAGGAPPPIWRLVIHAPQDVIDDLNRGVLWRSALFTVLSLLATTLFVARITLATQERNQALARLRRRTVELDRANASLSAALARQQTMRGELVRAEKLSSLGLLVAGVAHELNTPIGAAAVASSTLEQSRAALARELDGGLRRSALTGFLAQLAEGNRLIERNLGRAAGLIRLFKQLAVDRAAVERRTFPLAAVVDDTLHMLRARFPGSPHAIVAEVPADLTLDSYPGPLGQVLENLMSNALLHAFSGPDRGTVRIAARALPGGEGLEVTVSDDGCGISADQLKRIFDPFVTTRRGQGGTGLGLHLAHHLSCELLGGSLTVASPPGQGSCFTLAFPRVAPLPPAA